MGKDKIVHGNLDVRGDKVVSVESKVVEKGYFTDKFGNTIYRTDSKENKERLMKYSEDSFPCSTCDRVLKTKSGRTKHEKSCG